MRYERVLSYVASSLWAITADKMAEIVSVLAFRAAGHEFTAEEIEARIGGRAQPAPVPSGTQIAVIPIRGVIAHRMNAMEESSGGTSAEGIGRMLSRVAADASIGTIVYDIDSPGGTVTGIAELAAQMFALRGQKRQVAHVNGLAASAAYWLASQADEIVSLPSGRAGSIGVFTAHADLTAALEKEGVKITTISAGKHKVEGQPFAPLSDEARAFLQAQVDDAYQQFTADVARGRGTTAAAVRGGYGEGRALVAKDALAAGLIDRVETFEATLGALLAPSAGAMRAEAEAADADRLRRLERF